MTTRVSPQQALRRILRAFLEPWLVRTDPRALAICRLLVFGFRWPGFRFLDVTSFAAYERLTSRHIGILGALQVPVFSADVLKLLGAVASLSTAFALLGFAYRITAPIAATTLLYLSWIVQSSGKTNHGGLLLTWVVFVLAFSRAADAWSVDAWIRKLRGRPSPAPSAEYTWPIRFIALMVVSMYGAAGISKLRESGFAWGLSGTLRWRLLTHHFTHTPPTRIGVWIADSLLLSRVLGFLAHLLELASPLALLHRAAYRLILPSLALLQLGIWLMMGVLFREMVVIFVCLLPWNAFIALTDEATSSLTRRLRAQQQ